jgi:hypothetical protein
VTKANPTPEREFQKTLVGVLELFGYQVNHTYPLRTEHGWRTGTTAIGWPDLTAVRPPRLLVIEVKGEHTPLEEAQRAWLSLFAGIPCARAWVLRPTDPPWPDVQAWIRRPKEAPRVYGFDLTPDPLLALANVRAEKARRRATKRQQRSNPPAAPTLPLDTDQPR